jgi:hypothetical protein
MVTGQPTKSSIEALTLGANYHPYMPYRSVRSVFFNRKGGNWNVKTESDGLSRAAGLGKSVNSLVLFQYQPIGTWNAYESSKEINSDGMKVFMGNVADTWAFSVDQGKKTDGVRTPGEANVAGAFAITGWKYNNGYLDQSLQIGKIRTNKVLNKDLIKAYAAATTTPTLPDGISLTPSSTQLCMLAQSTCTNNVDFHCGEGGKQLTDFTTCYSGDKDDDLLLNINSRQFQKSALQHAQSASFIAIIIVQWADLVICKTRWLSIRQQGMSNPVMNFALIWECLLGALLCYIPGIPNALGTAPLRLTHWMPAFPFSIFIFLYDETRKYLMRCTSISVTDKTTGRTLRDPGWIERFTYY